MTKKERLRLCDRVLAAVAAVTLASSVQLEAMPGRGAVWVWCHIVVGVAMLALVVRHLYLHFGWRGWPGRLRAQKSPVTRWLGVTGLLVALSAVAATAHWLVSQTHATVGGVHGKLGFIFMALCVGHTLRRARFLGR